MKYNDTIEILKTIGKAIFEDYNKKYDESVPLESEKSPIDSTSHDSNDIICHDSQKDTSSNPQGILDSITQELTSVRLQQAIILSEIVGKPKSKTRKRRRF